MFDSIYVHYFKIHGPINQFLFLLDVPTLGTLVVSIQHVQDIP